METLGSLKGDFVLDGELVAFDQEPPGSPEKEFPSDALIISASANLSKWVRPRPAISGCVGGEDAPTLPIDSETRELIFLRGILVFTDLTPERELSTRAR